MKLSMSSVDSRSLFVSGGDVARAEVRTSSGIFRIFILFILEKSQNFENVAFCQNIEFFKFLRPEK